MVNRTDRLCTVSGCERPQQARGYCDPHYRRWKRYGDPGATESHARQRGRCTIAGCNRPHRARGYCDAHYLRWWKSGDPGPVQFNDLRRGVCSVEGCERPHNAHGYCVTHYDRWKRTGDPGSAEIPPRERGVCSVDSCDRSHFAQSYCETHYNRVRAHGNPLPKTPIAFMSPCDYHSYAAVHGQVNRKHGVATGYTCQDCPNRADEWSYNHTDQVERIDSRGCHYSTDISHYSPRCRSCHRTLDARITAERAQNLWENRRAYRESD